jgi:hypothetical protein
MCSDTIGNRLHSRDMLLLLTLLLYHCYYYYYSYSSTTAATRRWRMLEMKELIVNESIALS